MSSEWLTAIPPVLRPTFGVSGWNRCRGTGCSRRHRGMDFRARTPLPVFAILDGTVLSSATTTSEAGQMITVQHVGGLISRYLHLSKRLVSAGDTVTRGQQIADSGDSGAPGRPHLHFDLLLPKDQLDTWRQLFGEPTTGFPTFSADLVKVPVEPLITIDSGNSHVFREAKKAGITVRQDQDLKSLVAFFPRTAGFTPLEMGVFGGLAAVGATAGGIVGRRRDHVWIGAGIGVLVGAAAGLFIARQLSERSDEGFV